MGSHMQHRAAAAGPSLPPLRLHMQVAHAALATCVLLTSDVLGAAAAWEAACAGWRAAGGRAAQGAGGRAASVQGHHRIDGW